MSCNMLCGNIVFSMRAQLDLAVVEREGGREGRVERQWEKREREGERERGKETVNIRIDIRTHLSLSSWFPGIQFNWGNLNVFFVSHSCCCSVFFLVSVTDGVPYFACFIVSYSVFYHLFYKTTQGARWSSGCMLDCQQCQARGPRFKPQPGQKFGLRFLLYAHLY